MKTTSTKRFVTLFTLALAGTALSVAAFAQPAVQPVDPKDVPEAVRRAHEEQMRKRAEQANQPVAPGNPAAAQTPPAPPAPVVRETPTIRSTDAQVLSAAKMFVGTFLASATGEAPALVYSSAVVNVEGLDNAVYFEVARADAVWQPFRQGVLTFYKRQGQLRVRQFDFGRVASTFGGAVANLWMAPEVFPKVSVEQLSIAVDMPVELSEGQLSASTGAPFPTTFGGAMEMTSVWKVTGTELSLADRGFDASGKQVFGTPAGASVVFARVDVKPAVRRMDNGVVVIDVVPPSPDQRGVQAGGEGAVHYTGWLTSGEQFGTSYGKNAQTGEDNPPMRFSQGNMIPGFNEAILGVSRGTVRRMYIPAAQGYGPRARGRIPANSDLIFLVEGIWAAPKVVPPEPKGEGVQTAPEEKKTEGGK
jgi:hypothetical protein